MTSRPLVDLADAGWLQNPATQCVFDALTAKGHAARVVGGTVRNALLGEPTTDIDIATTATPQTVMALAADAGLRTIPTGLEHGTITILVEHTPFEITTLRRDVSTDGRRATVAFTEDWREDASRRDFTINALYCDRNGRIFDPLNQGLADLEASRVRFIGDPATRIAEDYLRSLRLFRFSARYAAGRFDREGLEAVSRNLDGLSKLSPERIHAELLKILSGPNAVEAVTAMRDWGVLVAILDQVPMLARLRRLITAEATLGAEPNPVLRFAALSAHTARSARRLADRLRLSNTDGSRLETLSRPLTHDGDIARTTRKAVYHHGNAIACDLLMLAETDRVLTPDELRHGSELARRWQAPRMPVSGRDLLDLGLTPGPQLGELLSEIEARWIASDFSLDRQQLLSGLTRT